MFTLISLVLLGVASDKGTVRTVKIDGAHREYVIYDPVGQSTKPKRAILAFHGFGQEAEELEKDIGLNKLAKSNGFVVVYPKGLGKGWNAGSCCGDSKDVEFIDELIKDA